MADSPPGKKQRVKIKRGLWIEIGADEDPEEARERFLYKLEHGGSKHKGRELQKKNNELTQITGNKKK